MEAAGAEHERARVRVEEAVRQLLRAVSVLRTYPADNHLARDAISGLGAALKGALPFALDVSAAGFTRDGTALGASEADRGKVAVCLFRDGVRQLELRAGLEAAETERLVLALARTIHPDDLTEDYVTRLWEADLPHVGITAIDPYLDADIHEQVLEGREAPQAAEPEDLAASREALPEPPEDAFVVTEADALRIAQEVEQVDRLAPWGPFIEAVFATLRAETTAKRSEALVEMVEASVQRCLESGRWKMATEILRRVRGNLPACHAPLLRKAAERMASAERLLPLHGALERGECAPADAEAVLAGMSPLGLRAACALLVRTRSGPTRRFYAELLAKAGSVALPAVLPAFEQAEGEPRALLVGVLGRMRDRAAAALLLGTLGAEHGPLRREVVRALTLHQAHPEVGERLLLVALDDPDRACRIIALRGLARANDPKAQARILERLESRGAGSLEEEEKDLLFAALGRVGDDAAVPFLRALLKPGWLFGGADREGWRRAATALARLGTPEALRTLEEHAEGRHAELAQLCTEALLEARRSRR